MAKQLLQRAFDAFTRNEKGNISWGKMATNAFMVYSPVSNYLERRDEGEGIISSALGAAAEESLLALTGFGPYLGYQLLSNAGTLVEWGEGLATQRRAFYADEQYQAPFRSNTFVDNEQLYTMRQAGMALAQQAKYKQVATMMGNEARYMHR